MIDCPYGNLLCEFPDVPGSCVYCDYSNPLDGHCDECEATTWHIKTGREDYSRCIRCLAIHPHKEGILTANKNR